MPLSDGDRGARLECGWCPRRSRAATRGAAAVTRAASYSSTILGDNPVAYYRLEELSGTTAVDETAIRDYVGDIEQVLSRGSAGTAFLVNIPEPPTIDPLLPICDHPNASILYADLSDLMLMLDIKVGGGVMAAVNEGQQLVERRV